MSQVSNLFILTALLVFDVSAVYATDAQLNMLPVIERQVVKISAVSNDGVHISIPRTALTMRHGIPGVFVVEKNEARFRMVRPGKIDKTQVEILSGLFGDETLVMGELEVVHDGSPITLLTKTSPVKK